MLDHSLTLVDDTLLAAVLLEVEARGAGNTSYVVGYLGLDLGLSLHHVFLLKNYKLVDRVQTDFLVVLFTDNESVGVNSHTMSGGTLGALVPEVFDTVKNECFEAGLLSETDFVGNLY